MGIKDLFSKYGMKAGTAVTGYMLSAPELERIILDNFSSITMENAMKPDFIIDKQRSIAEDDIVVSFNPELIEILDWAKANNMSMRGHTIVWHGQTPDWIFYEDFDTAKEYVPREKMLLRLESFIKQIFEQLEAGGYSELFYAYDVVNEAWREDGSMRDTNWLRTIGEDYLIQAFSLARKYAPKNIDLYYNDYNEQLKTETLLRFVDTLKDAEGEYLLDGIGLQAHLYTMDDLAAYFDMVDRLAETGLKLQLTELDVSIGAWKVQHEATPEKLDLQGRFYYELINGLLKRVAAKSLNMDAVTVWGFADKLSWRIEASPLLFNDILEPKPAYFGMIQRKD